MKIFQGSFCEHLFLFFLVKNLRECFPGGTVDGNLPANAGAPVQSRSGSIPHATEQLNPCTTTPEPGAATAVTSDLEPALHHHQTRQRSKKPAHSIDEKPTPATRDATAARKTQHSQK